jgi:hypothetical protein
MADVTFRDFAGAVMQRDLAAAGRVLGVLLGLDEPRVGRAAAHFQTQMTTGGPAFMTQAMGLRTAVTSGTDAEIATLLTACFGLAADEVVGATAALRARYPH